MKIESTLRVLAQLSFFTGALSASTTNSSTVSALLSNGNGKHSLCQGPVEYSKDVLC